MCECMCEYMCQHGRAICFHPPYKETWRGVELSSLAEQWWSVANEHIDAFEAFERARASERARATPAGAPEVV